MSIPAPAVARLVALLALGWAGPAAAQSSPDGRAWTDPPARGAAMTPAAPTIPDAETPPAVSPVDTPAPRAVVSRPRVVASKPHAVAAKSHAVAAKPPKAAPKSHIATIRRWPVVAVRAQPGPRSVPVRTARVPTPDLRPVRYGFVAPPPPPFAYDEDPRAGRLRQAEAAGYLVVRRTTLAAPDGRFLYGYRPYGVDDFDD